jgi:hypothetical protein
MTESSPFAAAIKVLEEKYAKCRTPLGTYAGMEDKADSIEAAIRVLEAAGKIDKERLMLVVNAFLGWLMVTSQGDDYSKYTGPLMSFLSALPDGELFG